MRRYPVAKALSTAASVCSLGIWKTPKPRLGTTTPLFKVTVAFMAPMISTKRSSCRQVPITPASRPCNLSDAPHGQYGDGPDDGKDPGGRVKHAVVAAADRQDDRSARRREGEG